MSRVLVVYGSETGQSKQSIIEIVNCWKSSSPNLMITGPIEGGKAAEIFDESINSSNYDYLLVCTSSYGDGDCPSGYGKFLYALQNAASCNPTALKGLQHSVLGCGSTAYETFQNCPRLTDRAMGGAGSRRCLMRAEVDEMEDDSGFACRDKWAKDIEGIMNKGQKGTPELEPVCEWTEPLKEVYEKNLGPNGQELGLDAKLQTETMVLPVLAAIAGVAYYYFVVMKKGEEGREGAN